MQELLFWLIIIPSVSVIAVLVLFREQLFDSRFMLWLRAFARFFIELAEVYDLWPNCFLEELLRELEEQQRILTYTPLLVDDSCPEEKEEEQECMKLIRH